MFFEKRHAQSQVNLTEFHLCGSFRAAQLSVVNLIYNGEFDGGSGRTLAACLTHASQGHGV